MSGFSRPSHFACTPVPASTPSTTPGKYYSNPFLNSIDWKQGRIELNYLDDRIDLNGDKRLVSIEIFEKNQTLPFQEIVFNQDYFTSAVVGNTFWADVQSNDYLTKRLKLLSVVKRPVPDISLQNEKYSFSYYEGDESLPSKNSFAVDHWGFYNGKHNNQSFIPNYQYVSTSTSYNDVLGVMGNEREPFGDFARAFSLKEITYPTKGKTVFYYGNNDYEIGSGGSGGGGPSEVPCQIPTTLFYPASQKGNVYEIELDLTDEFVSQSGNTIAVEVDAVFRANQACKDVTATPNAYFELYYKNGGRISLVDLGLPRCESSGQTLCIYCDQNSTSPVFTYKNTYILPPGKYTWKAFIASSETNIQDITATYRWWAKPFRCGSSGTTTQHYALAGGLRISRIEDLDAETGQATNVRTYDYHYEQEVDGVTNVHSYGRRMVAPSYSYFEVAAEQKETIVGSEVCLDCVHLIRTSDSNTPPFNSQGYAVGYDKVIETFGVNAEFGSIVYEYENQSDQVDLNYYSNGALAKPSVFATRPHIFNGMLKKQTVRQGNTSVKEIVNDYRTQSGTIVYGLEKSQVRRINMESPGSSDMLLSVYPTLASNFIYLSKSNEKTYHTASQTWTEIVAEYSYDNPSHLQLSKTKAEKSDGNFILTEYKYPADFPDAESTSAIMAMKSSKYMHSLPVEVTTKEQAPDGLEKIIDRELTVYKFFNSRIFPSEKVTLETDEPLSPVDAPPYIPANPYDEQLYEKLYTWNYDQNGNVISVQKTSDMPVNYLWGYNESFPIAEVSNGNIGQSFHTSFETDGEIFENSSGTSLAKTGNRVLNLSTFTFPASYTPDEANTKMSYWFWSNNSWNFSGLLPFQRTINVSGSRIDEVRAYPENGRMRTFTYDTAIGLTTITDENDVTQYFEYDVMGRLKNIKDNEGNTLKTIVYHYKEQ